MLVSRADQWNCILEENEWNGHTECLSNSWLALTILLTLVELACSHRYDGHGQCTQGLWLGVRDAQGKKALFPAVIDGGQDMDI
jgi:hypothetical protein